MTSRWANYEDVGSSSVFEALHSGLTVNLIATPRNELMICGPAEQVSEVMERNTEPYDYLPVIASSMASEERIVGLFHAAGSTVASAPKETVGEHLIPLSEEYLIGADASILDFIKDADTRPCRLVVSGARVVGLVSLSDLQKLPVRAALFALITGFEITMYNAIKRATQGHDGWIRYLSEGRQKKILDESAVSREGDGFVDGLLFTQFCDKTEIIIKNFPLTRSKTKLRGQLDEIQGLRDKIAHANEYASSPEHARNVCTVVRSLLALREEIAAFRHHEPGQTRLKPVMKGLG